MSKERLEKAKKILNHIKGYDVYDGGDDIEVFEWLIQQAERVQELEQENKQIKEAYQDRCDDIDGLLEHFNTSWEELIDE